METALENFNNNRSLSLPAFCVLLKIPAGEMKSILRSVEHSHDDKNDVIIHLHHIKTLEFIIREINRLFEMSELEDREAMQLLRLVEAVRRERHRIVALEKRVFNAPRRVWW